ncbi:MAG: hypothetical protein DSZ29_05815 [Aquificaceae bacterium]|nr:MAG: hypothetical protein DSZ29_05815 [Aquificaceae bacterium]
MTRKVVEYKSPNNVMEQAIIAKEIPQGVYKKKDKKKEEKYLAIDFYSDKIALCPKTWSTSPATMVRDISASGLSQRVYEKNHCSGKTVASSVKKLAKFKPTMNQRGTSGTFSTSSLLYYHFSRYFDTVTIIPVAIYREMDRKAHRTRVTKAGKAKTSRGMIAKAWDHLYRAETSPRSYRPTNELFTPSRSKIYGALIKGKGSRYGAEVNGARRRAWGSAQNEEFQETAPYFALRSDKPLLDAIKAGKRRVGSRVRSATGDVSDFQMLYWMRELTEIVLLDYIFSQQDRVGNIDYRWAWYWVGDDGKVNKKWASSKVSRRNIDRIQPPAEIAQFFPNLVQRTHLNDNDAGGRVPYANFAKRTGMLQKLRHFSAKTYSKLIRLDRDLQDHGPIYRYIEKSFVLDSRQRRQIVKNTRLATEILKDTCSIGKLRFDLDNPKDFLLDVAMTEQPMDCHNP